MSEPLATDDLHLRTNGHADPIARWPLQAVRTRGHRDLIDRLAPAAIMAAIMAAFALIALVSVAGVGFFAFVLFRLLNQAFGGR